MDVLVAKPLDDLRAGSVTVAENAGELGPFAEFNDKVIRKTRGRPRKVTPVKRHGYPGELPVPGWRVLASGYLGCTAEAAFAVPCLEPIEYIAACQPASFSQPQQSQ